MHFMNGAAIGTIVPLLILALIGYFIFRAVKRSEVKANSVGKSSQMKFYVLLGLGVVSCLIGSFLLISAVNFSNMLGSGELQMQLIQQGRVMTPNDVTVARNGIFEFEFGGVALLIVGIVLGVFAFVTRNKG